MIERVHGDLLSADVDSLVNTVNTVGVMGKGIALQFKKKFPDNFRKYKIACDKGEVVPGKMFLFDRSSRIIDIKNGLVSLVSLVKDLHIESIAVPPLGCGNGGLHWNTVSPLIEEAFSDLQSVRVMLFERK